MSPALVEALVVGLIKYGPEFVTAVIAIFKKDNVTVADVEALFSNVRTYESYGIPDVAPTAGAVVV